LRVQRFQNGTWDAFQGITPALAGTTGYVTDFIENYRDHPRACGYNQNRSLVLQKQQGSPPRLRVQRRTRRKCGLATGITPALAGTTFRTYRSSAVQRDHPRACGYNFCVMKLIRLQTGSPPRLRVQPRY